ncbi:MAG: hypothetical protein LBK73_11575 [Treponema sp.]|nr:hypothetical protein [Treponema sp.]
MARIADKRREGYDKQYEHADALKGAYGVFFFQHPSMLEYQERLKRKNERCNAQTILRVDKMPGANRLTRLLDEIAAEHFSAAFDAGLQLAERYGALDRYQVLGNCHLVALDGVWFYQSRTVQCEHCPRHKTADGETLCHHDMAAAAAVKHGREAAAPLPPEFIRNEDGREKQDCERNAAKRRLERHGERYRWLNPVFLGEIYTPTAPPAGQFWKKGCIFCLPASLTAAGGCMIR